VGTMRLLAIITTTQYALHSPDDALESRSSGSLREICNGVARV